MSENVPPSMKFGEKSLSRGNIVGRDNKKINGSYYFIAGMQYVVLCMVYVV